MLFCITALGFLEKRLYYSMKSGEVAFFAWSHNPRVDFEKGRIVCQGIKQQENENMSQIFFSVIHIMGILNDSF